MGRPIQITADVLINQGSSATGWTASGTGASQTTASVTLPDGSSGTRVKATSGSGQNLFLTYAAGNIWATKKGLFIRIYLDAPDTNDPATIYSGYIRLRNAATTEQFAAVIALRPGWNEFRLSRGKFTQVAGTTAWDAVTFNDMIIKIDAVTSTVLSIFVDNLAYAGFSKPQVAVMFDDGYSSVIDTAYPYMAARGIVGSCAVISSKVDTANFMTAANLATLHAAGWAMVGHTVDHTATSGSPARWLQDANQATCQAQIEGSRDYLISQGFTRDNEHLIFCSPYGEWSANYKAAADAAGILMFCTLAAADPAQPQSCPFADSIPGSRYVPRVSTIRTWSVAQITAYIDAAIASGTSIILLFHKIVVGAAANIEYEEASFKLVIDHLHRKRGMIDLVNLSDWYSRCLAPTK